MISHSLTRLAVTLCLALGISLAMANDHPAVKRAVNPPPSAELSYTIKARHSGLTLGGDAHIRWQASANRFDIDVSTKASMLGKILESHSEGEIGEYGLAPSKMHEKRLRKQPFSVTFGREDKTIRFSESAVTYPLKGGEQDRTSVTWQIASIARSSPETIKPGTQWTFLVTGRREAEVWTFKVVGRETVRTPMGEFAAVHITKLASKDREQQHLDFWLAPALEWYPVRSSFKDANGLELDQTLRSIQRR